jgi:hypothetical protein
MYSLNMSFFYWALPQFALDFAGHLIAEPLEKGFHELDVRSSGEYCFKLRVCSRENAVG